MPDSYYTTASNFYLLTLDRPEDLQGLYEQFPDEHSNIREALRFHSSLQDLHLSIQMHARNAQMNITACQRHLVRHWNLMCQNPVFHEVLKSFWNIRPEGWTIRDPVEPEPFYIFNTSLRI
jgi:hypothetical protein